MTLAGRPSFSEAFQFWLKLGFISFGGPGGQIAIMHAELVERKRWISEERFLHALNYCMMLPGPEAQQLATYMGWLLHRTAGGVVAGALFVLPSFFILVALSWVYVTYGAVSSIAAMFYGLKAAVLSIVAAAVIRIGWRALKNEMMVMLAALSFVGIFFGGVPFPLIIISAAVIGLIGSRLRPDKFCTIGGNRTDPPPGIGSHADPLEEHTRPSWRRALTFLVVCLTLWTGALACLAVWGGSAGIFYKMGKFFSKAAMVTFGGAYAVLPYIAQAGVETYHWLQPGQMIDGLGLAETTPGPLIMVVTFVGYVGAWSNPAGLTPPVAGFVGALVATYFTFLPSFLWIFLGAPYIERTRGNAHLMGTLSAITAAVVGVILNLAVFFGLHVFFPTPGAVDWASFVLAVVTFVGLWKFKWDVVYVVLGSAMAGLAYRAIVH
ncbi:MAG: chromate transporter [Candidatus Lindowbacteria bacterium RIFCSPLOWO2_02_FULL_62_12]|nr:MAG: chromate transporter [Candidatus Lindowbacteria bacterium RIFCSPLOWO2_02_FULL_62_12]